MGAVRLGKIALRWCMDWNLPVIERKTCGACGHDTIPVSLTPPGDFRPAFDHDLELIRKTIDRQFGEGTGESMLPLDKIVVLNKSPGVDRLDEVIIDGHIVGTHIYLPGKGWSFVIRMMGAHFIHDKVIKGWVTVDNGAVPSMRKGSSAMAIGVLDADPEIEPGHEIIVSDQDKILVCTGKAKMTGTEMMELMRGPALKNRWRNDVSDFVRPAGGQTWKAAVAANVPKLEEDIEAAARMIHRTVEKVGKPVVVSFSGGKDSLATLLLVLDAGIKPKLLFIDTGIEFQETLDHIDHIVKKHDLEIITAKAGEAYFDAVKYFGPSAKDFRWCCKTCKLGPTADLIREHYPDGVLSFIGQRQYESESRYQKGGLWVNPWVPGQVGASPIQKWTSLEVWLYIFYKGEEYNPLYARGFERIGCWLCPSADMSEHSEIPNILPRAVEWNEYLMDYAKENDLPEEWVTLGLWRWKKLSKGMRDYLVLEGLEHLIGSVDDFEKRSYGHREEDVPDDMSERVKMMASITGGEVTGAIIRKALHCVGCGICVPKCEHGALELIDGKIYLYVDKCVSCGECMHPCPVVDYPKR